MKPKRIASDPARIARSAEGFFRACRLIRPTVKKEVESILRVPLAVNEAMALELFLKCLATLEKGDCWTGHDLKELYDDLDEGTRFHIETKHKLLENESVFVAARKRGLTTDAISLLIDGKDAFRLFRYAHENSNEESAWLLGGVMIIVRQIIFEKYLENLE